MQALGGLPCAQQEFQVGAPHKMKLLDMTAPGVHLHPRCNNDIVAAMPLLLLLLPCCHAPASEHLLCSYRLTIYMPHSWQRLLSIVSATWCCKLCTPMFDCGAACQLASCRLAMSSTNRPAACKAGKVRRHLRHSQRLTTSSHMYQMTDVSRTVIISGNQAFDCASLDL